jgi:hypothetical protein
VLVHHVDFLEGLMDLPDDRLAVDTIEVVAGLDPLGLAGALVRERRRAL